MNRLIRVFVVTALLAFGALTAFNLLVDPFAEFGSPRIAGFNESKTEAFKYDRRSRRAMVLKRQPDCLLLGSSRVAVGFDGSDASLSACERVYNGGLAGATMEEAAQLLRLASEKQPPKLVVLLLDLFMFNAMRPPEGPAIDDGNSDWRRGLRLLRDVTATDTMSAAFYTLRHQNAEAPFDEFGALKDVVFRQELDHVGNQHAHFLRGQQAYIFHNLPPPSFGFAYRDGQRDTLKSLRWLIAQRHRDGGRTVILFSPAHVWQWQLLRAIGLDGQLKDLKRHVVTINVEEARRGAAAPFDVFDFSGYGEVQAEEVPPLADFSARLSGYWDGSHFGKDVGSLVLRAVLHDDPMALSRLGERIDSANIESHLREVELAAQRWRQSHPDAVNEIDSQVACYAPAVLAARLQLKTPEATVCRRFRLITR